MMRDLKLRFLPLALVAFVATACDDSSTDPEDLLADLDASAITTAIEANAAPMEASLGASYLLSDFYFSVLGGGQGSFDRHAALERVESAPVRTLMRNVAVEVQEVPEELLGKTFVWDVDQQSWVVDEGRAGAPGNGVRVIWYATDDFGAPTLPLTERGYIDITDQSTSAMERLGVTVVRTAGGTITLSDFVYGYAGSDDDVVYSHEASIVGYFSDGTDRVDVDIALETAGNWTSGDESADWDMFFDGPEGSYHWVMTGDFDGATEQGDADLLITVVQDGDVTVLDLATDETLGDAGTGTLTHKGVLIANINIANEEMTFTKPGGGAFTGQQAVRLEQIVSGMVVYGIFLLFYLPFVGF